VPSWSSPDAHASVPLWPVPRSHGAKIIAGGRLMFFFMGLFGPKLFARVTLIPDTLL